MSSIEKTKKWEDEDCYEIKENRPPPPEVTMKKSRIDRIRTGRYADDGQRQTHTQKKTKENRHPIEKAKTKDCVTDNGGRVTKEEHEFNETLTTANSQSTASQRDRDSLPETAKKKQKKKQKTIARLVGGNVLDPSGIRSLSRKFKVTKKKHTKKN